MSARKRTGVRTTKSKGRRIVITGSAEAPGWGELKKVLCEDIQPLLFDYMNRELGEGRAAMVREHLRKCKACQAAAKEIRTTLDLLQTAKAEPKHPDRLSQNRREQILRELMHPLRSWLEKHLLIFSIGAAVIVVISVLLFIRGMIERRFAPMEGEAVTVILVNHGHTNVIQGSFGATNDPSAASPTGSSEK